MRRARSLVVFFMVITSRPRMGAGPDAELFVGALDELVLVDLDDDRHDVRLGEAIDVDALIAGWRAALVRGELFLDIHAQRICCRTVDLEASRCILERAARRARWATARRTTAADRHRCGDRLLRTSEVEEERIGSLAGEHAELAR